MRPWSFSGDRGKEAAALASIAAPLLPLSPPPLFVCFLQTLCRPRGAQRVAATGLSDRPYLSLGILPLMVSACSPHLGVRPRETVAVPEVRPPSGRSCSLSSVLFLLLVICSLCCYFLALPSYCSLLCAIVYFLCSCFWSLARGV